MQAVMETEIGLGHEPADVSAGASFDIESRTPDGVLRFLEVKGYGPRTDTVTLTSNEILLSLNSPEAYILALVEVDTGGKARAVRYVRAYERQEPPHSVTSVSYNLKHLLAHSEDPR